MASSISLYGGGNYSYTSTQYSTSKMRFNGTVTGYKGKPVSQYASAGSASSTSALSSTDAKEYTKSLKENANDLKKAADKMLYGIPPVFEQMQAAVDKSEVMSVTYDNKSTAPKAASAIDVDVEQLAATQKNTGDAAKSAAITSADKGYNTFAIDAGGKTVNFTVKVGVADSNKTVQQNMADAINSKKDLGVTAKVVYDDVKKESSLVLESKSTGSKNSFSIRDVEGKGNLVAATGANKITQTSKDALFSVNGTQKQSSSNTTDIGNGITATFKKTGQDAKVEMKKDVTGITNSIHDMVNSFNGLLETAKKYGEDSGAQNVIRQLTGAVNTYKTSLEKIGVGTNKSGYITLDSDKLKKSIEDGSAEKLLGKSGNTSSYGFVQKLSQIGRTIDANPSQFVSKASNSAINTSEANRYTGGAAGASSDYMNQYYSSRMAGVSYLFDSMA